MLTALCCAVRLFSSTSISLLERRGSTREGSSGGNTPQQGCEEEQSEIQESAREAQASTPACFLFCGTHKCSCAGDRRNGFRTHTLPEGAIVEVKPTHGDRVRELSIGIKGFVVEHTANSAVGMGGEGNWCARLSVRIKLGVEKSRMEESAYHESVVCF